MRTYLLKAVLSLFVILWLTPAYAGNIAALGRIVPSTDVINLFGPSGDTVKRLNVKEGDTVSTGDVLAYLKSYETRRAEKAMAELRLQEARTKKEFDIRIQRAREASLKMDLDLAKGRLQRLTSSRDGAPGLFPLKVAERQAEVSKAESRHKIASLELERMKRLFPIEIQKAEHDLKLAGIRLDNSVIRAPINAKVLKVLTREGEATGRTVMFKIGDVEKMYVIAEVYESDALRLRPGQKASVTSVAFPGKLRGTVESIGSMIYKNTVSSLDPSAMTNARVVEVWVRLEPNEIAEKLVYLQVDVLIHE